MMAIVEKITPERLNDVVRYKTVRYDYYRPISVPERKTVYRWLESKGWEVEHGGSSPRLKKGDLREVPVGCAVVYEIEIELAEQAGRGQG